MVEKLSGGEYNSLIFFLNIYYYFSNGNIGAQSLKDTQPPSVGLWDLNPLITHIFPKANVLGTDSSQHIQSLQLAQYVASLPVANVCLRILRGKEDFEIPNHSKDT